MKKKFLFGAFGLLIAGMSAVGGTHFTIADVPNSNVFVYDLK